MDREQSPDDSDSSERRRSRSRKHDKHRHRSHSRKHRRRDKDSDTDDDADDRERRRERKRHKKESKKSSDSRRDGRKKDKKSRRDDDDDDERQQRESKNDFESISMQRSYKLADSLYQLFQNHPALVEDLPIMMIQLARGTSFNLSQMTDAMASNALQDVFQCLIPFGLDRDETGCWVWKSPEGASRGATNELILLQVVRGLLNQIGITMEAVEGYASVPSQAKALIARKPDRVVENYTLAPDTAHEEPTLNAINEASNDEEEDEVGPSPTIRVVGPALPPEVIKAQANKRARELAIASSGVQVEETVEDMSGREEWMLTPGKVDFLQVLSNKGQSTASRKFENKKQSSASEAPTVVDPKVQSELNAILKAHSEARGPTLLEQHRSKLAAEKEAGGGERGKDWKWNRDKDLDSDRRVDKSALQQVFGGATEGLQKKFQGGFR